MKRKKTAVVVIIVVLSVITILISMWIVNENKHSKKDQEIDGDFIKKVIKSGKLDRLTPIGIDRFMADVPQIKMPISTANYLQTLNNFNTVFPIDSITRLDDNRVAVVYLLKSEKNSLFAVLLFEKTILDSSEKSSIDPKMYFILLDEIQYVNGFEDVLNSMLHIKNADTYVTGSNSKFLSSDIITEFKGRGDKVLKAK